jgi:hypothetical protein
MPQVRARRSRVAAKTTHERRAVLRRERGERIENQSGCCGAARLVYGRASNGYRGGQRRTHSFPGRTFGRGRVTEPDEGTFQPEPVS